LHEAEPGSDRPATFADPANSFHEKEAWCRAAENTCFFASVNCASENSGTIAVCGLMLNAAQPSTRRQERAVNRGHRHQRGNGPARDAFESYSRLIFTT
jgi:hypothetical protein